MSAIRVEECSEEGETEAAKQGSNERKLTKEFDHRSVGVSEVAMSRGQR